MVDLFNANMCDKFVCDKTASGNYDGGYVGYVTAAI